MNASRAVALAAFALCLAPRAGAAPIDFLHVAANVGGSSGGHYAIRFGDDVYHFQNDDHHLLAPQRDDYEHFRWAYAVLENRTINVARVDVPDDAYVQLRDRFNGLYLAYQRQRALLAALQNDLKLLAMLAQRAGGKDESGPSPLVMRGAGLFGDPQASQSPALDRLRTRVVDRYGSEFLRQRNAAVLDDIRALRPRNLTAEDTVVAPSRVPATTLRFSEQYEALVLQHVALEVLTGAAAVNRAALRDETDDAAELALTTEERGRLDRFADQLEERLITLIGSHRPDWGFALLVGMARLDGVRTSVATGRLTLLDGFPADAKAIEPAAVRERAAFFGELAADEQAQFVTVRSRLFSREHITERDFSRLEEAGNRFLELRQGVYRGRPIRIHSGTLVPSRPAPVSNLPLPALDGEALGPAVAAAREAAGTYESALRAASGYHLTKRNCVTEIFRTIEATLGERGSIRYLGGYIDPTVGVRFAPFVVHDEVLSRYNVVAAGEIPSYRRARLAEMNAHEGTLTIALREANVLTSTLYRRNESDSFFLFFTDDAVLPRPLYGLVNLAAGAGETALGVVTSPFDRGHRLTAGVLGMAFSIPELFLVNIRKGTFEYGPTYAEHIPIELAARGSGNEADH